MQQSAKPLFTIRHDAHPRAVAFSPRVIKFTFQKMFAISKNELRIIISNFDVKIQIPFSFRINISSAREVTIAKFYSTLQDMIF